MRCPGDSVLCLSPPLVALLLTRLAIRSGQSHPGLYTQPHQPGSGRRATVLARSEHSAATEEPAPSVTLPPTSVHVIVWCGDTPVVLRSLGDRCERHKTQARAAPGVHVGQSAPKAASKVSHEARRSSEECVGSHAPHRPKYEPSRFADSSPWWFASFFLRSYFFASLLVWGVGHFG